MNKDFKWELSGFFFTSIIGTLLHFVYDWSGKMNIVGIFSPVNESIWEHLKLLYVPAFIWMLIEFCAGYGKLRGFLTYKAAAIFLGMFTITAGHYIYSGIIGRDIMFIDITLFYTGVFITSWLSRKKMSSEGTGNLPGIIFFSVFSAMFVVFTFSVPSLGIFSVPQK